MHINSFETQVQSTSAVARPGGNFTDPCASEGRCRIGDNNLVVGGVIDLLAAIGGVSVVFMLASAVNAALATT